MVIEFRTVVTLGGTVTRRGQMEELGGGTGTVLFLDLGGGT